MTDFDPFVHARDVKANPDNYVTMRSIVAEVRDLHQIRHAPTLKDLESTFRELWVKNKPYADVRERLKVAKDERKKELGVQA